MNLKRFSFTEGAPLNQDERGSIRVTGSRVTLDTVLHRFHAGDTVDLIHESFPTVSVPQIKAIIEWYHNHQAEADEYIYVRDAEAERLLQELKSRPENIAFREKIRRYRLEKIQRYREQKIQRQREQLIKT
jgi:uncharacterized protein (DUF433 family)